jgi:ribosomal protein S18 acetylase RimI-like enzyme
LRASLSFMRIRRVGAVEWRRLRDIRLRALAEAPYAFATTYEEATAQPQRYWEEMLREPAWIAEEDGRWVGMVRATQDERGAAHLISMWVDPAVRRAGAGKELVAAVTTWARNNGLRSVVLWVAEGNVAAEALYRSMGFADTGERQPLPSDPSTSEAKMRLVL